MERLFCDLLKDNKVYKTFVNNMQLKYGKSFTMLKFLKSRNISVWVLSAFEWGDMYDTWDDINNKWNDLIKQQH
jgi:hypothetical protein